MPILKSTQSAYTYRNSHSCTRVSYTVRELNDIHPQSSSSNASREMPINYVWIVKVPPSWVTNPTHSTTSTYSHLSTNSEDGQRHIAPNLHTHTHPHTIRVRVIIAYTCPSAFSTGTPTSHEAKEHYLWNLELMLPENIYIFHIRLNVHQTQSIHTHAYTTTSSIGDLSSHTLAVFGVGSVLDSDRTVSGKQTSGSSIIFSSSNSRVSLCIVLKVKCIYAVNHTHNKNAPAHHHLVVV